MDLQACQSATIYVWETTTPFDIQQALHAFGEIQSPTPQELAMSYRYPCPKYHTVSGTIYHTTKQMHQKPTPAPLNPSLIDRIASRIPTENLSGFRTPLIEERLEELQLTLPDHELTITPRLDDINKGRHLNLTTIAAFAINIELQHANVLAVPGASIETTPIHYSRTLIPNLKRLTRAG